jgi:hypothetical protein
MSEIQILAAMFGAFSIHLAFIFNTLQKIERNTRPPKPDIKSFINRNTKGDRL